MSDKFLLKKFKAATRHSLLATFLLLTACGHKTDLRLPTAEDNKQATGQTERQPVNRGATQLPPAPRF